MHVSTWSGRPREPPANQKSALAAVALPPLALPPPLGPALRARRIGGHASLPLTAFPLPALLLAPIFAEHCHILR